MPTIKMAIQRPRSLLPAVHKNQPAQSACRLCLLPKRAGQLYRGISFVDRFLPTDSSQRDVNSAQESYNVFQELIRRFPNSKYAPDAKQRMVALRNNIAMHEARVAQYYMKRKAFVAAVTRCNLILKDYQRTPAVPYALKIMQEAYTELGLTNLAQDAKRVFNPNYPQGIPNVENPNKSFMYDIWDFAGSMINRR